MTIEQNVEKQIDRLTRPNQYAPKYDIIGLDTSSFAAEFIKRCHKVRQDAATELAKIGAPAVESLIAQLKNKEQAVRVLSATALGMIADGRAVQPLITALSDTDDVVRCSAAEALGSIGEAGAAESLTPLLEDKERKVRKAAADAIGKITGNRPKVKGGCYIATATMGDNDHPTVLLFQHFREQYLEKCYWGRSFVEQYYKYSPRLVQLIERSELLKKISYLLMVRPLEVIIKTLWGRLERGSVQRH